MSTPAKTVLVMMSFLGAVVWIILALRVEGLVQDSFGSATASVFGIHEGPKDTPRFTNLIALAAGLVTLGTLMFGIIWSCQRRGAHARLAHAEETCRRYLRKLAKTRARLVKQKRQNAVSIIPAILLLGVMPDRLHAAACPGETNVALLDATTAYDDIDRAQIMRGIESWLLALRVVSVYCWRLHRQQPDPF